MASLRKNHSKWVAQISIGTGGGRKFTYVPLRSTNKTVARARLSAVNSAEDDIKSGVLGSDLESLKKFFPWLNDAGTSEVVRLTLDEAIERWLDSRYRNNIRTSTLAINKSALGHFTDMLGSKYPVAKISIGDISRFREERSVILEHSPTTINMNLRSIKTFLNWLVEHEFITNSPKVKQVHVLEPEVKYLTEMQIADLFKLDLSKKNKFTAKGDVWVEDWEHYKRAFQFYLSTGCRLREPIIGTVEGMWLDVSPALSKNHIKRSIELDGDKLTMLNEIRDKVFSHPSQDSAIRKYSRNFRKACDVIGVRQDISFHSLRHTFACIRRLQTNGNMALVRDELGHKHIATTERYCNIPIRRLQDDFPTYAKSAKNDDVVPLYVVPEPSEMESLVGK